MITTGPLFIQLAEKIKGMIAGGTYQVGSFLPSVRRLQDLNDVSKNTVLSALKTLQEDGIIGREGASRHGFRILAEPLDYMEGRKPSVGGVVKFIMPFSYWNYAGSKLLESLEIAFGKKSVGLLFGNHQNKTSKERTLLERILEHQAETVDALILMPAQSYGNPNIDVIQHVASMMPVYLIDRRIIGIDTHVVSVNNRYVGQQAADLLLGRGVRRFGFVTEFWSASSVRDRFIGFRERLEEAGHQIDPRCLIRYDNAYGEAKRLDDAWDVIDKDLKKIKELPGGIFCASDKSAGALIRYCERNQISIPDETALIGCDADQYVNSRVGRTITSFNYPYSEIVSEVIRLYQTQAEGTQLKPRSIEIDATPVSGDTA